MGETVHMTSPVQVLAEHLQREASRPDFDMDDRAELAHLLPFPKLHAALVWLDANLLPRWREADSAALIHHRRHDMLARIAISMGAGAVVLAIVQLAMEGTMPELKHSVGIMEGIAAAAAVIAVAVGLRAKSDHKWIGCRHRAERLRMLKFQALAHPDLWEGREEQWKQWVLNRARDIPAGDDVPGAEAWATRDAAESDGMPFPAADAASDLRGALTTYYRHKRLLCQRHYFDRKGTAAKGSWGVRLRGLRMPLFVTTIAFVLLHFGADWGAGSAQGAGRAGLAHALRGVSVWGIAFAALLPVLGLSVRAWSATFELSRKARCFAAKCQAMGRAAEQLGDGSGDLGVLLGHMQRDELFLAQEHREWLRLLLDAEWFI